tara:strand:+ start:1399 stop:1701 length:303 start_codon:yes stop_codon:yes gene_type:complete
MSNKIETSLVNNLKEKEEIIIKKNEQIVENFFDDNDETEYKLNKLSIYDNCLTANWELSNKIENYIGCFGVESNIYADLVKIRKQLLSNRKEIYKWLREV